MFTWVSLLLLISGLVSVVYLSFKKRGGFWWVIAVSIVGSFWAVIFSIPPPALHRFSLAFPLLSLVMAAGFYWLIRGRKKIGFVFIAVLLVGYGYQNIQAYWHMVEAERLNDSLIMAREVESRCEGRGLYVAAYLDFALSKIMHVVSGGKQSEILTDYHKNLDEDGRIYQLTESISLFKN